MTSGYNPAEEDWGALWPQAFDWVMREVEMPSQDARAAFYDAFMSVRNEGHNKAMRVLRPTWVPGAQWCNGEGYLRVLGWLPSEEIDEEEDDYDGPELMELLFQRLRHVHHRMYRAPQVRAFIDPASPTRWGRCTHVMVNRNDWRRTDPCGIGPNKLMSIEEGLAFMQEPAHSHPACGCTVDPYPV